MKKKRISLAILGCRSLKGNHAKMIALKLLIEALERYKIIRLVTIKDDPVGKAARLWARSNGIKTKTIPTDKFDDQSARFELTVAATMWEARRFILITDDHSRSYADVAVDMVRRMHRKHNIFDYRP